MMKCKIFTIIIAAALFAAAASGCSGRAGQNAGPERPVSERESGLAGTGSDASAITPIPGDAEPPSSGGTAAPGKVAAPAIPQNWSDMRVDHSMELLYADQFSVDYYDDGFAMITIADDNRYLVVPEGEAVPNGIPDGVTVVRRPLNNIYLVATSAMDLFCSLDAVDRITLSGTDASGWYIREARQAIESGTMSYAGKYSAPDYELILSKSCDLAVESTMIYHSPEVKEQLETLGIPVLVERSSYESHPLGRMEWLKLYAVLLGREELAGELFNRQMSALNAVMGQEPTGKTVAFFYVSSNGYVNVRKPGDYVAKMIELAGGTYAPRNPAEPENALSTMNMQMEAFYAAAKDADYIIYNSTIDGELKSLDALLAKSSLLADFKAVKEGRVWCTEKNLFQESMGLGTMILDIHRMLTEEDPDPSEMTYIYPLR
ncbi:ABC transporter substrate-binding protein [Enterocloster asparagiformis]|uniref:ABC transporter substrate-binding protein n=1 Tax=Enterocloster asparagiformis TaxID=333367 RepID=UPI002A8077E8|nr:ABC transporter substrate-binding protein [Enterocloster asparagiformis]